MPDIPSPLATLLPLTGLTAPAWSSAGPPTWPGGVVELALEDVVEEDVVGGDTEDEDKDVAAVAAETALEGTVLPGTCECCSGDGGCWSLCAAPRPNMAALRREPFLRLVFCCCCCCCSVKGEEDARGNAAFGPSSPSRYAALLSPWLLPARGTATRDGMAGPLEMRLCADGLGTAVSIRPVAVSLASTLVVCRCRVVVDLEVHRHGAKNASPRWHVQGTVAAAVSKNGS